MTNHHVVKGADEIRVSLSNKSNEYQAEIVGSDEATDIAVLRLKDPPSDLQSISFGDASQLELGEPVVAIGNPFGLSGSVTYGIVSAKGRQNVGLAKYEDFIQTDAAINPGNSGGALVNTQGELVGINTAILSRTGGYQGIGFAVPSNMARSIMRQLLEDGEVERGRLGVMIQDLSPKLARALEVPEATEGVVISKVQPDSPAAEAGLERGDVITAFGGEPVGSSDELQNEVAQRSPGTNVKVRVWREGDERTISVRLGSLNGPSGAPGDTKRAGALEGLILENLDAETRRRLEIPKRLDEGIAVLDIERGSPAARTGLRPGDVIVQANRKPVTSVEELTEAYRQAERRVLLLVYRNGRTLFVSLPKP